MATLNLANGYSLSLSIIEDKSCQFVSLRTEETALGKLPTAEIVIRSDSDVVELLDEITLKITPPDSNQIEAKMYVYSLGYRNTDMVIKLISCNPKFLREPHTNAFTNIKNAVSSLYPGQIITNTESDLLNDTPIYQKVETDYNLVKRLLLAWKKNSVFGFALDGIRINDLNNFESVADELVDRITLDQQTLPEYTAPKMYTMDTQFIDYSDGVDPNHQYVIFNDKYIPVNNEYKELIGNYLYNQRFETTPYIANFSAHKIYNLNLTDGVKVSSPETQIKPMNMYLSSRTIMIDLNSLKVDYTLRSINSN